MRKVVVYIACSLDGYIAKKSKDVSWLGGDNSDPSNLGSYDDFYKSIDTVIIGSTTYEQIVTELAVDNWPYKDKMSYVITSKKKENKDNIIFTDKLVDTINHLKNNDGSDIWICGGASIINQLLELDMIDKICVSIMPIILGDGINLFTSLKEIPLSLVNTINYNGIVDLVYERR